MAPGFSLMKSRMTAREDAGEGSSEGGQKEQRVKNFRSALNNMFLPHKQLQPAKNVKPSSVGERVTITSQSAVRMHMFKCVLSKAGCLAAFAPIVCKCPLYCSLFVQEEQECGNHSV